MAIVGIGTDIIEISRIEKQTINSQRLAERVLTVNEMAHYNEHNFPARFLAKRFAAKEAAVKALGTGIGNGISFQQIEVGNLESGQPYITLSGKAKLVSDEMGITSSFISISDEQKYAVATVVMERG